MWLLHNLTKYQDFVMKPVMIHEIPINENIRPCSLQLFKPIQEPETKRLKYRNKSAILGLDLPIGDNAIVSLEEVIDHVSK